MLGKNPPCPAPPSSISLFKTDVQPKNLFAIIIFTIGAFPSTEK